MQRKKTAHHKLISRINCGTLGALLIAGNVYAASAAYAIPEKITINSQANQAAIASLPKDSKDVKDFSHLKHTEIYLKGQAEFSSVPFTDDFTCSACHLGAASSDQINNIPAAERLSQSLDQAGGPQNLKKYYHDICLNCHKAMKKAQKTTGPSSCKGCHLQKTDDR